MAEKFYGSGKKYQNLIYVNIGTGLSYSQYRDNEIYQGNSIVDGEDILDKEHEAYNPSNLTHCLGKVSFSSKSTIEKSNAPKNNDKT